MLRAFNIPRSTGILLFSLAAVLAVAGVLLFARHSQLESAYKRRGLDFKNIAIAVANYQDTWGVAPKDSLGGANNVPHSWRWNVNPFVANWKTPWDGRRAWSDPENREVVNVPTPFRRPGSIETRVFAFVGESTALGDMKEYVNFKELPNDIILFAEVRNSGLAWPAVGDFVLSKLPREINSANAVSISGDHPWGFFVAFADGAVWCISYDVPFEAIEPFLTVPGATAEDREELLKKYLVQP